MRHANYYEHGILTLRGDCEQKMTIPHNCGMVFAFYESLCSSLRGECMKSLKNAYHYLNYYLQREINYYQVRPTNMLLFLTYRCTSRCKPCTMWQRKVSGDEMSLEEWKRCIDMVSGFPIENVEMFGGDALLRKDVLLPLTEYTKFRKIPKVDLVTNCNLLDEKTIDRLLAAGIDVVSTSLDGIGKVHDEVRGVPGTFERVKRSLAYLVRAKKALGRRTPKIVLNCTISRLNADSFEKVYQFGVEMGVNNVAFEYVGEFPKECLPQSQINGLVPKPYFASQDTSLMVSKEQAYSLKKKLKAIKEDAVGKNIYINSENIDILSVENMTTGLMPVHKCYICRYLISIDPYGNVMPCPFFESYAIGNVRNQPLKEIWNNEKHRVFIENSDSGKLAMCRHCILGVERNPTIFQALKKQYFHSTGKGYDEEPARIFQHLFEFLGVRKKIAHKTASPS